MEVVGLASDLVVDKLEDMRAVFLHVLPPLTLLSQLTLGSTDFFLQRKNLRPEKEASRRFEAEDQPPKVFFKLFNLKL